MRARRPGRGAPPWRRCFAWARSQVAAVRCAKSGLQRLYRAFAVRPNPDLASQKVLFARSICAASAIRGQGECFRHPRHGMQSAQGSDALNQRFASMPRQTHLWWVVIRTAPSVASEAPQLQSPSACRTAGPDCHSYWYSVLGARWLTPSGSSLKTTLRQANGTAALARARTPP